MELHKQAIFKQMGIDWTVCKIFPCDSKKLLSELAQCHFPSRKKKHPKWNALPTNDIELKSTESEMVCQYKNWSLCPIQLYVQVVYV